MINLIGSLIIDIFITYCIMKESEWLALAYILFTGRNWASAIYMGWKQYQQIKELKRQMESLNDSNNNKDSDSSSNLQ